LSQKGREEWFKKIKVWKKEGKLDFSYAMIAPSVIDKIGINPAIQKAINVVTTKIISTAIYRSTYKINSRVNSRVASEQDSILLILEVLLDGGLKAQKEFKNQKTIIKGDEKIAVISAASIVAKVMRDRLMVKLSKKYPKYGFKKHKGYGTTEHYKNIEKYGLIRTHRKSFLSN